MHVSISFVRWRSKSFPRWPLWWCSAVVERNERSERSLPYSSTVWYRDSPHPLSAKPDLTTPPVINVTYAAPTKDQHRLFSLLSKEPSWAIIRPPPNHSQLAKNIPTKQGQNLSAAVLSEVFWAPGVLLISNGNLQNQVKSARLSQFRGKTRLMYVRYR